MTLFYTTDRVCCLTKYWTARFNTLIVGRALRALKVKKKPVVLLEDHHFVTSIIVTFERMYAVESYFKCHLSNGTGSFRGNNRKKLIIVTSKYKFIDSNFLRKTSLPRVFNKFLMFFFSHVFTVIAHSIVYFLYNYCSIYKVIWTHRRVMPWRKWAAFFLNGLYTHPLPKKGEKFNAKYQFVKENHFDYYSWFLTFFFFFYTFQQIYNYFKKKVASHMVLWMTFKSITWIEVLEFYYCYTDYCDSERCFGVITFCRKFWNCY